MKMTKIAGEPYISLDTQQHRVYMQYLQQIASRFVITTLPISNDICNKRPKWKYRCKENVTYPEQLQLNLLWLIEKCKDLRLHINNIGCHSCRTMGNFFQNVGGRRFSGLYSPEQTDLDQ
jgi:hypothetical protein